MTPATSIDPINTAMSLSGPRKAPSAPISFQSPPPNARSRTKGNRMASPRPAPDREAFIPGQPSASVLTTSPNTSPGRQKHDEQPSAVLQHAPQPTETVCGWNFGGGVMTDGS